MAEDLRREDESERQSRLLLIRFLTTTDPLLERLLQFVRHSEDRVVQRAGAHLRRIWNSARQNLKGVIQTIQIGLSRARRRALQQIGMFGDALAAKWELLSFDFEEGALMRISKRLNSMLSSLSKVFRSIDAVKEFKDHLEVTLEGLQNPPDFITLGDLLEPR